MDDELEIREDEGFQERQSRFERAGTLALVLVLVAALLGLFGAGLLGEGSARTADGALSIEYPRFARMQAPVRLRLALRAAGDEARVWLAEDYLTRVTVEGVSPEPERTELGAEGTTYVFALDGTDGEREVVLEVSAPRPGSVRGRVGTDAENSVALGHFVYP